MGVLRRFTYKTLFRVNIGRFALRTLDVRAPPDTLDIYR
jgi:hypothetical protein